MKWQVDKGEIEEMTSWKYDKLTKQKFGINCKLKKQQVDKMAIW
jgi:hypothetical protein